MAEYGDQVTFDLKTGEETRIPATDEWVIENIRYVEISAEKTTIKADGKDSTFVTFKLQSGELVSKPGRKDIQLDCNIAIFVEGERHSVELVMGEGEVEFDAVHAGKYPITVEHIPHNEFVIEATDEDHAGAEASSGETSGELKDEGAGNIDAAGVGGVQESVSG